MIEVKIFASLRAAAGEKGYSSEAANVRELLQEAAARYGEEFASKLAIATVLVNGKNIAHLRWKRTRLGDGDVVSLFPPLAGG